MNFNFGYIKETLITDFANIINLAFEDTAEGEEKEVPESTEDIPVKVEEAFIDNDLYLLLFNFSLSEFNRFLLILWLFLHWTVHF